MSVGVFEVGKYESNSDLVFPVRVQPETKGLTLNSVANSYPAAAIDAGLPSARLSNNNREFGVVPRRVVVELTENGTGAVAGYLSGRRLTVPIFRAAMFDGIAKGQTGTYLGIACVVRSLLPERVN